ncbi:MAG: sugar nucleotide-binding protein [Spongiibacteraceae bacterium]|nr:sugar nucleotide-binding protein [Spongiibacteraceae bacterium]
MNKRLIIIGASGMIGKSLQILAGQQAVPVITTSRSGTHSTHTFDCLSDSITALIPDLGKNDVVCMLAAISHINEVAAHYSNAHALNVQATQKLLTQAGQTGARCLFISTEQIFDGKGGFDEHSTSNPPNRYSQLKVETEQLLLANVNKLAIIRTGALVGNKQQDNCVVSKTYHSLLSADAQMASDNVFSITDLNDISEAILSLCEPSQHRLYHAVAEPPVSRTRLADWIIQDSHYGADMHYNPCEFSHIPYNEPRGKITWMKNKRFCQEFNFLFKTPRKTVYDAVKRLDQWRELAA